MAMNSAELSVWEVRSRLAASNTAEMRRVWCDIHRIGIVYACRGLDALR